jgi:hypothetical protein
MVVRIRFGKRPNAVQKRRKKQRMASLLAALLTPAAAMAAALAMWGIAAGLNVAGSFAISSGFFSHWQVWLAAAIGLQVCSRMLNRYGRGRDSVS